MNNTLTDLKKAKAYSDARQYDAKHQIVYQLVKDSPNEFFIDSEEGDIVGLTHDLTGFRLHVPRKVIADLQLQKSAAKKLNPIGVGFGQISTALKQTPSQFGALKSQLTKATNRLSVSDNSEEAARPETQMFPATTEYYNKKTTPLQTKAALSTGPITRGLGYAPGVWYDEEDNVPGANRMRFGNLVSGAGLAGLGLAAVPVLQYLFPERFKDKRLALNIAAVTGGLALPWLVNFPHTGYELSNLGLPSNEKYTDTESEKFKANFRAKTYGIKKQSQVMQKEAFLPLTLPIPKMQLADVAAEQFQSGFIDYGQAAGLMQAAAQSSNKPWITVGDLAKTAIGAGAGVIAGTAAAKGIGLFMNISPTEQKVMQGTGAALGALIRLGKLSL